MKMNYVRIEWVHKHSDEPIEILFEINVRGEVVRRVEVFQGGKLAYALGNFHVDGGALSEVTFSGIEEYNSLNSIENDWGEKMEASEMSELEFLSFWNKAVEGPGSK